MIAKPSKLAPRTPKFRYHKATGQGYIILNGKAIYLGRYDDPTALQNYHKTIAEWIAGGRQLPIEAEQIKIKEVIVRYWAHAQNYYVRADGTQTNEVNNIRQALRPLRELYGETAAVEFGPIALRAVRQKMIDLGWCRNNVNKMIGRIKRMFRWSVEQEHLPGSVFHTLQTVIGLHHGRSEARETAPVRPVPQEHIDAVEPYVSRQIWVMVQLQLLTGARSGELVIMRPCNIDRSGEIWIYTPGQHKTLHHDHQRQIFIGPRGQLILQPFLNRLPHSYFFSPAEARAEYQQRRCQNRKTPKSTGNSPGTNIATDPQRQPGDHYTVTSYGHAIRQAVKRAFRPADMTEEQIKTWKAPQHWHPHQLRHNAGTFLRKEFGLETAQILLGHRKADVTQIYAERDLSRALEVASKIG